MTGVQENRVREAMRPFKLVGWLVLIGFLGIIGMILFNSFAKDGDGDKEVPLFADKIPTEPSFDDLLDAIEWVESRGDANAIGDNGRAVGAYQIHKIFVDDLNRIYKLQHNDKYSSCLQWRYYHRENKVCSRIIARDYLRYYGGTIEDMARKFNGGPNGHKKESTKSYWLKVKARMEEVKP